jgi:ribulose 1,5-bisphosphate carboxylase large subunit-like protein
MVWLSFRRCSVQVEERKNLHINELMKKHEKAFGEIKNYYNDITHNNLDLIKYDSIPVHPS